MLKLLSALLIWLACTAAALAQTVVPWPLLVTQGTTYDFGNGPMKLRVINGVADLFTSQGSGTGSTSGSSTALTLTGTPATPPCVGCTITGSGITAGTTVTAYNGTTGVTLSAAMTVPASTPLVWGAACPSVLPAVPLYIQASTSADYYQLYTTARVCGISPGGPAELAIMLPYTISTGGGSGAVTSVFGRTGDVIAQSGDYSFSLISGTLNLATQTAGNLAVSHLNSGTGATSGTFWRGDSAWAAVTVGNLSGLGTGVGTALGVNVGTAGAVVINGGALGTPSSANLTNATSCTITACVSGLGTGVATFLGTPTSANLAAALTDETGTGAAVFGTSPSLTTPAIAGATVSGTANFTGTFQFGGNTQTFPGSAATLAALNLTGQTLSGGANVTSLSLGTLSSFTVNCGSSPLQFGTINSAITITAPANDGSCILRMTNGASAGAITFSGWTVGSNTGDTYATTNANKYDLFVRRINGVSSYQWSALQ